MRQRQRYFVQLFLVLEHKKHYFVCSNFFRSLSRFLRGHRFVRHHPELHTSISGLLSLRLSTLEAQSFKNHPAESLPIISLGMRQRLKDRKDNEHSYVRGPHVLSHPNFLISVIRKAYLQNSKSSTKWAPKGEPTGVPRGQPTWVPRRFRNFVPSGGRLDTASGDL